MIALPPFCVFPDFEVLGGKTRVLRDLIVPKFTAYGKTLLSLCLSKVAGSAARTSGFGSYGIFHALVIIPALFHPKVVNVSPTCGVTGNLHIDAAKDSWCAASCARPC